MMLDLKYVYDNIQYKPHRMYTVYDHIQIIRPRGGSKADRALLCMFNIVGTLIASKNMENKSA